MIKRERVARMTRPTLIGQSGLTRGLKLPVKPRWTRGNEHVRNAEGWDDPRLASKVGGTRTANHLSLRGFLQHGAWTLPRALHFLLVFTLARVCLGPGSVLCLLEERLKKYYDLYQEKCFPRSLIRPTQRIFFWAAVTTLHEKPAGDLFAVVCELWAHYRQPACQVRPASAQWSHCRSMPLLYTPWRIKKGSLNRSARSGRRREWRRQGRCRERKEAQSRKVAAISHACLDIGFTVRVSATSGSVCYSLYRR